MRNKIALALMGVTIACGCGVSENTISGTVAYSNGSALTKGTVSISNDGGSYQGSIGPDGKFTIEKVKTGKYNVAIVGALSGEQDLSMNYDDKGNYVPPKAVAPKSLIKAEYSDPSKSGLSLTVPGDYNLKVDMAE